MRKLGIFFVLLWAFGTGTQAYAQVAPGLRYPLWDWRFIKPANGTYGSLPQTLAYYMKEDTLRFQIQDGVYSGVNSNQIMIVLSTSVGWRKEIQAFNLCNGTRTQTITTGQQMILERGSCLSETIVFRKDKFIVGMTDMYNMDFNYFWKMWAGKVILVSWIDDGHGNSQYPPVSTFPVIPLGTNPSGGLVYDTDNKADVAVFSPSIGFFSAKNSSTGISASGAVGGAGDIPVPKDYDGDGQTDIAVFRPGTGQWLIVHSLTGVTRVLTFGTSADTPVPGDYDGDGKIDFAVFNPPAGRWIIKFASTGGTQVRFFGTANDIPVPGDYDGDHITDLAVWRPSTGTWFVRFANGTETSSQALGLGGQPVPADYDGDGKTDMAVFQSASGAWTILNSSNGTLRMEAWGVGGDHAVPRDYDGDNKADVAVWRPSTGEWIGMGSTGQLIYSVFGLANDLPVPSK